jgi:hypothetical protein
MTTKTMTMDEIRAKVWMLRGEMRRKRIPADDIVCRLLREDMAMGWPIAIVEEILALRDQIVAMRTMIEMSDREVEEIRSQVETLRDMLPEETTDV